MMAIWDALWAILEPALSALLVAVNDNLMLAIGGAVALVVPVASGALAATVAELRGRKPLPHFIIGACVIGLYPLVIHFVFKHPMEEEPVVKDKDKDKFERQEGPPPVEAAPDTRGVAAVQALVTEQMVKEQGTGYNEAYFRGLQRDAQGNPRGPFELMVSGNPLRAQRIVQVQPTLLVLETVNQEGKTQTLRIPFDKIDSCQEL